MREHIDYEYAMMQSSYKLYHDRDLWDGNIGRYQSYFNNLFQVDFFVHANNLIQFAWDNKLVDDEDRLAVTVYKQMIENQIVTLTESRTAIMEEKLQPDDLTRIKKLVEKIYGKTL